MNPLAQTAPENTFAAVELNILKEVGTHMDTWIDQMCKRTDELLQASPLKLKIRNVSVGEEERAA